MKVKEERDISGFLKRIKTFSLCQGHCCHISKWMCPCSPGKSSSASKWQSLLAVQNLHVARSLLGLLPSLSSVPVPPTSHTSTETARGRQDTRTEHSGVGQRAAWQEGLVPNTRCRRAQGGDSHLSPHPGHCAIMRPYLEHSRPLFFSRSMRKFLSLVVGKVTSACCLLSRPVSCSQGLWRHLEAEGLPLGQTEVRGQSGVCAAWGGCHGHIF